MTFRERLERLCEGLPPGASVTLPVEWLRAELQKEPEQEGGPGPLLDVAQVAARYGVAESTARSWCARGELDGCFKVHGGAWRIPQAALLEFDERQRSGDQGPALGGREPDLSGWRRHFGQ